MKLSPSVLSVAGTRPPRVVGAGRRGLGDVHPWSAADRPHRVRRRPARAAARDGMRVTVASAADPQSESSRLGSTRLPNGWPLTYVSAPDVPFLYQEIFEEDCYVQNGITLGPGSVVLDVGANVGMFGMYAASKCPGGLVVCIEPVPTTFAALQANLDWIRTNQAQAAELRTLNCGVSDGSQQEAEFTFYTGAAGWSTMYPDDEEVQDAVLSYVSDALPSGRGLESNPLTAFGQMLAKSDNPAAQWIIQTVTRSTVQQMLESREVVRCKLRTVSQIIEQESLTRVDLLKVDVERAELEVLRGVSRADWESIQQVVMEVHDLDSGLEQATQLLKSVGFRHITTEQPGSMKGSELFNLFAQR